MRLPTKRRRVEAKALLVKKERKVMTIISGSTRFLFMLYSLYFLCIKSPREAIPALNVGFSIAFKNAGFAVLEIFSSAALQSATVAKTAKRRLICFYFEKSMHLPTCKI
jgi:hypothetical protein